MPWLKYELSYAHGYAAPEYTELHSTEKSDIEWAKDEIIATESDGMRTPRFEILDVLPPAVLASKIEDAQLTLAIVQKYLERLEHERQAGD